MDPKNRGDRFQILSLDGGGIKGLFSAAVLAKLEEDLGISIAEHFDLIAGTSTGGIIGLGLGLGLTPLQIVEFYAKHGPHIFKQIPVVSAIKHYLMRKYPQSPLKEALRKYFGERTLGESRKRLVIPAYNLDRDDVYIFKTPHHPHLRRDHKIPAWKVALATSAAPTFFSCCQEVDSVRLIDGGVWANNPVIVAIAEAVSMLGVDLEQIWVMSLGTSDEVSLRKRSLNWGGLLSWARPAVDVIMRGQSVGANTQALHLLGKEKIERLNPKVPPGLFDLDKITTEGLLSAAATVSREFSPVFETNFRPHKAAQFTPANADEKQSIEREEERDV